MPTDNALKLGKELAALLDEWDVLGRWMAHHIAELITSAEATEGDTDAAAARSRAAHEILLLWSHRTTLPRPYPLESYDRILAALDHLEDQSESGRLNRYFGDDAPSDSELAVVPILKVAARVDDELSDIVACLIAEAVVVADDAEARWVPIAIGIGEDQNARALQRLMSATRRLRVATPTQEPGLRDDPRAMPWADENTAGAATACADTAEGATASESENGESGETSADSRLVMLVEAIDRAILTLSQLKSAVTNSASSAGP